MRFIALAWLPVAWLLLALDYSVQRAELPLRRLSRGNLGKR